MWMQVCTALAVFMAFVLPVRFLPEQDFPQAWVLLVLLFAAALGVKSYRVGAASLALLVLAGLYICSGLADVGYFDLWLMPAGALLVLAAYFAAVQAMPSEERYALFAALLGGLVASALLSVVFFDFAAVGRECCG